MGFSHRNLDNLDKNSHKKWLMMQMNLFKKNKWENNNIFVNYIK